jgi:acetoin utilization deacetylase AcuC-like enzyme
MDEIGFYYPSGHEAHFERGHPERPERVETIRESLDDVGWWEDVPHLPTLIVPGEVMQSVHSPAYLNLLEMSCRRGGHLDMDTYTTTSSWKLAHDAAGGALSVASAVWNRDVKCGFALTRPPGHHATRGQGMGFCLLNNVALAAEFLIQKFGVQKVAIVDFDLHHGNGTQDIFWNRHDVFYFSTHQSPLFPGTGYIDEIGSGPGKGKNANFPFPPGSGDVALLSVMDEIILPLLNNYSPEVILVSYGFDTHWSDPLGQLTLSASGYGKLIARLTNWSDENCNGRIALFLEGGYNLDAAAVCSVGVVAELTGRKWNDVLGPSPYKDRGSWQGMLKRAKQMWDL